MKLLINALVSAALCALLLVPSAQGEAPVGPPAPSKDVTKLQIGVKYKPELCTVKAEPGDVVQVHYTGSLTDGTVFDTSRNKRNKPIRFRVGAGAVIKGWDQGVSGMCVGEKRKLKVPPQDGYGDRGKPPTIPGGATLIFETEMVSINGNEEQR